MTDLFSPLGANLIFASGVWLLSLRRRNASLVDLIWPLMFVLAAWIWLDSATAGLWQWLTLGLVMAWGLRLHVHLAVRNLGEPEDRRYADMRRRHSPGFWWKSFFIVFVLQAVLAWIASFAILGAMGDGHLAPVAATGVLLAVFGFGFEALGDWQLARFMADPGNRGQVMDRGLWRYTRHPNYFGECCFWWGIGVVAISAGAWWALVSPILLTALLLKVSGVSLLERDISERRPGYGEYVKNTPAFFPAFFPKREG